MAGERLPHVVIVGGGFGGLYAARALRRAPVRVTVIDRRNHHTFQPLLYQVANAVLSPADIAAPIRHILRHHNRTDVLLAEVADVDTTGKAVVLADGRRISYDFLIVSSGATHHYFGNPQWEALAPGLKTVEDAVELRRRYLLAFEAAEQEPNAAARRALLTFVVIGGGPTGVEMAGSMSETARHALVRDFRHMDPRDSRVVLLEGGARVLAAYDPALSAKAEEMLRELGVEVHTNSIVTRIEADAVWVGEERIPTRHVVWAAGVTASPLGARLGVPIDRVGRVPVETDLSIPGHPEVFVIGDLAASTDAEGKLLPGIAPVAMQQGPWAAANIRRSLAGEPRRPFRYRDKGTMAVIGRFRAVAEIAGAKLAGALAWLAWLFIHILYLSGFRNRIVVFVQWAWSFLTWQRAARLITGHVGPLIAPPGRPLGAADGELTPEVRDGMEAERLGQTVPADAATQGWMEGDAHQRR
ncbi:MAG: NAD(P)/FAD-dependent oxidoreductase [Gemmatimonadetes bacterium]|nr:NAD(P)/FAD-dependent oxidoreductase [Gemmatimonadota bacterium]